MRNLRAAPQRTHAIVLIATWAVLSIVGIILILLVAAPLMPPGNQTVQGQGQTSTMVLETVLSWPVMVGVTVYIFYHLLFLRQPAGQLVEGPPSYGNMPVQIAWVAISSAAVLFLAGIGIATLASESVAQAVGVPGRAVSTGPGTITGPSGSEIKELEVQVIAQQWYFTYRYPQYGGIESTHLELPVGVPVELHVTSLDVIHSWWAYQLAVKLDANPGIDNEGFTTPQHMGSFQIRCAELCGIWHGSMEDVGTVVSRSAFTTFMKQLKSDDSSIMQYLPPYGPVYYPEPLVKGG
jgi:cytochrome c oxidase subunit 2